MGTAEASSEVLRAATADILASEEHAEVSSRIKVAVLGVRRSANKVDEHTEHINSLTIKANGQVRRTANKYILHAPCHEGYEGIGSTTQRIRLMIRLAQEHKLTYVCQPNDFRSGGHQTGYMGFLFGCMSNESVIGNIASYNSVREHQIVDVTPETLLAAIERNPAETVFRFNSCKRESFWGCSYKWFRSQYHAARQLDARRQYSACQVMGKYSVVVHVRRGDATGMRRLQEEFFIAILDRLFLGQVPGGVRMKESEAHISILAETPKNDSSIRKFDKYASASVAYFSGSPEVDEHDALMRTVRDLDCMSSSDVLVMSGASFSSLGAAIQSNGVALLGDGPGLNAVGLPVSPVHDSQSLHELGCIHFESHNLPNAFVATPC